MTDTHRKTNGMDASTPLEIPSTAKRLPFFADCPICRSADHAPVVEFPELLFVRCRGCGLVFKAEEDPALSRRLAKRYDAGYFINGRAEYLKRWDHRVAKCRRQLLMCLEFAPHAKSILDVGCSVGYVLAAANSLGLHPTGMDFSAYAAGLAKERGYGAASASLTHLPFRSWTCRRVNRQSHLPTSIVSRGYCPVRVAAFRGTQNVDHLLEADAHASRDTSHCAKVSALRGPTFGFSRIHEVG
jgi:hypothetical protein